MIQAQDLYYLLGGNEKIKLLDATYGGHAYQSFLSQHIEGTQFFDIDAVADQNAPLPHTLPSADYMESCISALGISNDDHVVVYDQSGMYMASSRAWWMFRTFGHEKVYVLEGGLQHWIKEGFKIVSGPVEPPQTTDFKAVLNTNFIVTREDVLKNLSAPVFTVVDARPAERFHGQMQEPRDGMRAGHIPSSINLPFAALLDGYDRFLKPEKDIEEILSEKNLGSNDKIAVSCGSGVTACTVALALFKARGQNAAIYDGSWSEWGEESVGMPIELSA